MLLDIARTRMNVRVEGKNHIIDSADGYAEPWKQDRFIGRGGYGSVFLLKQEATEMVRAVKRITVDDFVNSVSQMKSERPGKPTLETLIKRELSNLMAVKDRQDLFVELLGWYNTEDFLFLAMEYVKLGDLSEYLKNYGPRGEPETKEITRQLAEGLLVLHKRNICHRDLKPQNILIASLSPIHVKLADFGISKSTNNSLLQSKLGTNGYIAPECFEFGDSSGHYTNAVDMWALGCVVHEILTSEVPFTGVTTWNTERVFSLEIFMRFSRGEIRFPTQSLENLHVSQLGVDFVGRLLHVNSTRMSAVAALSHSWLYANEGTPLVKAAKRGHLEVVRVFLDAGNDVNGIAEGGQTALQAAAENGQLDVIITLLAAGADVDTVAVGAFGLTALQAAAKSGNLGVVKALLAAGADYNAPATMGYGITALLAAVEGGHLDVVKTLLAAGAFANAPASVDHGSTALQVAVEGGHLEVVQALLAAGADINAVSCWTFRTALQIAAHRGNLQVLRVLLISGADVNSAASRDSGRTALQAAAESGNLVAVKALLAAGARINGPPAEDNGRTALQAAAGKGHLDIVNILLANEAGVNAITSMKRGRTALQAAAEGGHLTIVKALLAAGADVNGAPARDSGRTALQAAAGSGYLSIVKILLASGANVNATASAIKGRTAMQAAVEGGHLEVFSVLEDVVRDLYLLRLGKFSG